MGATKADAIRPFSFKAPEADLADLRKRINATKWPEREQVTDDSQGGVQLDTIQKLARYWATEHDWSKCEARLNALPQFITEIDGLDIHFIHEARERVADDRHAWMARLHHRAAQNHRAVKKSHGSWRECSGCLPPRDSVAAGLRLLRQADGARVEPGQHRQGVGDADTTPRLHKVRGAGWRLGQRRFRGNGPATAAR